MFDDSTIETQTTWLDQRFGQQQTGEESRENRRDLLRFGLRAQLQCTAHLLNADGETQAIRVQIPMCFSGSHHHGADNEMGQQDRIELLQSKQR